MAHHRGTNQSSTFSAGTEIVDAVQMRVVWELGGSCKSPAKGKKDTGVDIAKIPNPYHYILNTFTASVARLTIVFGNKPIQNIPAMQIAMATLAGPESKIGDKSAGAFLLQ